MSSTTIRNLIYSQIDNQLYRAKKDLRNQGTKQVQKVKEKLPSKDELKEKLISSSCERKAQDKMTKIYDKLIRLLDNLQKIPQKGLDKVKNIETLKPNIISTGNIGCITQISIGTNIPILHTVEILDWYTGGPKPKIMK